MNRQLLLILLVSGVSVISSDAGAQTGSAIAVSSDLQDADSPLILANNGGYASGLTYYSYIMHRVNIKGGRISRKRDPATNKTVGYRFINLPLLNIIGKTYEDYAGFGIHRIIVESKDSSKIIPANKKLIGEENYKRWLSENTWCYDLKIPISRSEDVYRIMRSDIERFFGLRGTIEKRKVKCLLLVRTDTIDRLATKLPESNGGSVRFNQGGNTMEIRGGKVSVLVTFLQSSNYNSKYPIVDGTDYAGRIDLSLKSRLSDLAAIKKDINKYGLDIVVAEKEIDMVIIRDVD